MEITIDVHVFAEKVFQWPPICYRFYLGSKLSAVILEVGVFYREEKMNDTFGKREHLISKVKVGLFFSRSKF